MLKEKLPKEKIKAAISKEYYNWYKPDNINNVRKKFSAELENSPVLRKLVKLGIIANSGIYLTLVCFLVYCLIN